MADNPAAVSGEDIAENTEATEDVEASRPEDEKPAAGKPKAEAGSVGFQELREAKKGEAVDLDFLLDIPLEVTVQIGRTKMLISDLLQLGQGSVIELTKANTDTSFDVLVNNKMIARGEIVVINDRFGVRLTDIVSPMERVQQIAY